MFKNTPKQIMMGIAFTMALSSQAHAGISICSASKNEQDAVNSFLSNNKSYVIGCVMQTQDKTKLYVFESPKGDRIFMEFGKNGLCTTKEQTKRECGQFLGM